MRYRNISNILCVFLFTKYSHCAQASSPAFAAGEIADENFDPSEWEVVENRRPSSRTKNLGSKGFGARAATSPSMRLFTGGSPAWNRQSPSVGWSPFSPSSSSSSPSPGRFTPTRSSSMGSFTPINFSRPSSTTSFMSSSPLPADPEETKRLLKEAWSLASPIPGYSPAIWRADSKGNIFCEPEFHRNKVLGLSFSVNPTDNKVQPVHSLFTERCNPDDPRCAQRQARVLNVNRNQTRVKALLNALELGINGCIQNEDSDPICWTPSGLHRGMFEKDPDSIAFVKEIFKRRPIYGFYGHQNLFEPVGIELEDLNKYVDEWIPGLDGDQMIINTLNLPTCSDWILGIKKSRAAYPANEPFADKVSKWMSPSKDKFSDPQLDAWKAHKVDLDFSEDENESELSDGDLESPVEPQQQPPTVSFKMAPPPSALRVIPISPAKPSPQKALPPAPLFNVGDDEKENGRPAVNRALFDEPESDLPISKMAAMSLEVEPTMPTKPSAPSKEPEQNQEQQPQSQTQPQEQQKGQNPPGITTEDFTKHYEALKQQRREIGEAQIQRQTRQQQEQEVMYRHYMIQKRQMELEQQRQELMMNHAVAMAAPAYWNQAHPQIQPQQQWQQTPAMAMSHISPFVEQQAPPMPMMPMSMPYLQSPAMPSQFYPPQPQSFAYPPMAPGLSPLPQPHLQQRDAFSPFARNFAPSVAHASAFAPIPQQFHQHQQPQRQQQQFAPWHQFQQ